ncbi:hypothetical protein QVA66_06090 [Staphylococcus chromogenes]|nr:hypothetical protein [Staphylococcus chromogenes]
MFTQWERKCALVGGVLLLLHALFAVGALLSQLEQDFSAMLRLLSALCYLVGFLSLAATMYRRSKVLIALFGACLLVGDGYGNIVNVLLRQLVEPDFSPSSMSAAWYDFALPLGFLMLGAGLIRNGDFFRVVGALYLLGGACWLLSLLEVLSYRLVVLCQFGAELFGMNATIALLVWGIAQSRYLGGVNKYDGV